METSKGVSPVVATVLLMGIAIATVSSAAVFIQGTMGDLQDNVDSWIGQEDRQQSSSMTIVNGYNQSGFLFVDVRNDGSRTLSVEDGGIKNWRMYIDSIPETWNYTDPDYITADEVNLNPTSVLQINTTVSFPGSGNSTEVEFTGPYGIRTSFVCFNENGVCES